MWLTGRPCSGKSTLAKELSAAFKKKKTHFVHLDGDAVRLGLNADLGFSDKDRAENLRRVAHVAELFNQNGICVLATFVSPTNELRKMVRAIVRRFKLCYLDCSLEECERRDVKGQYKKARLGQIPNFTGIHSPFERPFRAEITVDTENNSVQKCTQQILSRLRS